MRVSTLKIAGWLANGIARAVVATFWKREGTSRGEAVAYFQIGRAPLETKRLRAILPPFGYPAPHASMLGFGGGGYGRVGRRLGGGDGQGGGAARRARHFRTSSGSGMGQMFTGHLFYNAGAWRIFPYAGVGGAGQGFTVRPVQRDGAEAKADRLPSGGTGGPAFFTGWTAEYRLRLAPQAGMLVGVRVGWKLSPLRLPWFVQGFGDVRLPRPRLAQPYINLLVGGFVETERAKEHNV